MTSRLFLFWQFHLNAIQRFKDSELNSKAVTIGALIVIMFNVTRGWKSRFRNSIAQSFHSTSFYVNARDADWLNGAHSIGSAYQMEGALFRGKAKSNFVRVCQSSILCYIKSVNRPSSRRQKNGYGKANVNGEYLLLNFSESGYTVWTEWKQESLQVTKASSSYMLRRGNQEMLVGPAPFSELMVSCLFLE